MEWEKENNIFKYATKELSQDAFICWLINWFNYKDIKGNEKKEKLYELSTKILKKLTNGTNIKIRDIKEVGIVRQFAKIDITLVLTLRNSEQYIVIIEDKTNGELNKTQLKDLYVNNLLKSIFIDDDSENIRENIRENREKLGVNTQVSKNIIPVIWKTGKWKKDKQEVKTEMAKIVERDVICIDGVDTLNLLKNYIRSSEIIKDYYTCLEEKLKTNNVIEVVDEIVKKKHEIEIGTTFSKCYYCYNCFSNLSGKEYTQKHYPRGGGIALKNLNDKIEPEHKKYFYVSVINSFNADEEQWQNHFEENDSKWKEIVNVNKHKLETDIKYTFLFKKKRDQFGRNQYVFMGLYELVHIDERENSRLWKRKNKKDKKVSLKEEDILKLVQK